MVEKFFPFWVAFLLLSAISPRVLLTEQTLTHSCKEPFEQKDGHCVYFGSGSTSWCDAAKRCQAVGGELLMDLDAIRAVNHQAGSTLRLIGVTDLLVERGKSRVGWQFANGSEFPSLGGNYWMGGLPNNIAEGDDFLVVGFHGLRDRSSGYDTSFVCQPIVTPSSQFLRRTDFLRLGNISPAYCFTDAQSESQFHCLWLCSRRWECRAALFNRATGACRMLDHADASVGNEIETNLNWTKHVKSYD